MSFHSTSIAIPATGFYMDRSGLFGIERGSDGFLRPVGPEGSRSKFGVSDPIASILWQFYAPNTDEIIEMQAQGELGEAANEAYQFTRTWDAMAEGTVLAYMLEIAPTDVRMANNLAGFAPCEDGLVYLQVKDGSRSDVGVSPEIAIAIMGQWDGINTAADIAFETVPTDDPAAEGVVGSMLKARWDMTARVMMHITQQQAA